MSYPEQTHKPNIALANGPAHFMCASQKKSRLNRENKMNSPSMILFATLVFASSLGLRIGLAQTQSGKEPPKAVSVTGCLVKGDEPKEVWLAEKGGTIYGLESTKIELNAHLGHKVIVTGYVLSEGKEEPGDETHKQTKASKRETADFRVLKLKMISTTCTQ
jgi:hypothetical protein